MTSSGTRRLLARPAPLLSNFSPMYLDMGWVERGYMQNLILLHILCLFFTKLIEFYGILLGFLYFSGKFPLIIFEKLLP